MIFFGMKLRKNSLWWFKISTAIILFITIVYVTVRKASTDAKLDSADSPIPVDAEEKLNKELPRFDKRIEEVLDKDVNNKNKDNKHDAETIKRPGEHGEAYYLPAEFSKEKDKLYRSNGFNARASDDIALNRTLPDIRHHKCKSKQYATNLPSTSVIIPFFNEHWSTLLRTFISVLNRSPEDTLLEVILVDDGSDKSFLKKELDDYVKKMPKVYVIHLSSRVGLIRARLEGAKAAKGEVIIFLDSHTECTEDWLPPLLEPILNNERTCVCPFIDVIDYDTFAYRAQDEGARGAFDWEFFYKRLPILDKDKENMPEPFESPVMAGGLFAINAKFFWELGGYDSGLDIWGGEQYELSFKIWQCGGRMVDAPCSRIGHIYRKFAPFSNPGVGDFLGRNYKRVAEVWMDEYAEHLYNHRPHYRTLDAGDLTKQLAVRKKLNCKPFKWFMENVAFDLVRVYPPVEPPDFANGTICSVAVNTLCIDTHFKQHLERFGLLPCSQMGEQQFHLTWHKDIRAGKRKMCWDVSSGDAQAAVLLYNCHGGGGNQLWRYDYTTKQLIHGLNERCLDSNPGNLEIFVTVCDSNKLTQQWKFENYNTQNLDKWKEIGLIV